MILRLNCRCLLGLADEAATEKQVRTRALKAPAQSRYSAAREALRMHASKTVAQRVLVAILASLTGVPQIASAIAPGPTALQEFERYVQLTNRRMDAEVRPGGSFLRIEGFTVETRQQDE